jgi:hypothetical protein
MKLCLLLSALASGLLITSSALCQGFQTQAGGTFSTSAPPTAYGAPPPYYPPPKSVDNVGEEGQFIFSIERITGLFIDKQSFEYTTEGEDYEHRVSSTTFGLLGVHSDSPSAIPRFALDYVVFGGLTVGATFMLSTRSFSVDGRAGLAPATTPAAAPDGLTLLGGGRAGFAYAFDETFGIWPRAGLSYATTSADSEIVNPVEGESIGKFESETHFLQANLELLLAVSPVEHIVLFAGPYLDLGLAGGYSLQQEGESGDLDRRDAHLTSYGVLVHAGGYY